MNSTEIPMTFYSFEAAVAGATQSPPTEPFDENMWSTYAARFLIKHPRVAPMQVRYAAHGRVGGSLSWITWMDIPNVPAAEAVMEELRVRFGHHDRDKIVQALAVAYCTENNIDVPDAWADGWGL